MALPNCLLTLKGQCADSKIYFFLLLAIKVDKNTYFLETCFAYTILELEFMV